MIAFSARTKAHVFAAGIFSSTAVLYKFPPKIYNFYPRCPVLRYLHVECPGCGATRAMFALLHGRFADALHYNALAVFLVPLVFLIFANSYIAIERGKTFSYPRFPQPFIYSVLFAGFMFAIFRSVAHFAF